MANTIVEFITLKDSDHPRMLFALTKIQVDVDYLIDFRESHNTTNKSTIDYKATSKPGAPGGTVYRTYQVTLHMRWDDPAFPADHSTEVRLYDGDGTTLLDIKSMDTKDSPILR